MIITLVTDQFYQNNHGTSVSAQRFYDGLVALGHTVRVLAIDSEGNTAYALKERYFGKPINAIIHSQGMQLAKPDKETIKKAIEGADIVHVYMPFKLGYKTIQICREMNVPCTAGFHLVPENITSTLYCNHVQPLNFSFWNKFYRQTYRYIKHIHCPSLMVAKQCAEHKFHSNLHVISNGYNNIFEMHPEEKPEIFKDKIVIAFVGRFSREKRHETIIKAVKLSKYKDKIQLIFGGKGPTKRHIMKISKKLPVYPVFGFFTREQLISMFNFADLYIHPADIEVEGLSCLEAVACGCVPIVSDSKKSASSQFAVHEQSVFKNKNARDLAAKIDWWIEHPEELISQRPVVAEHAKAFTIEKSMPFYVEMFKEAIKDWDPKYDGGGKESNQDSHNKQLCNNKDCSSKQNKQKLIPSFSYQKTFSRCHKSFQFFIGKIFCLPQS